MKYYDLQFEIKDAIGYLKLNRPDEQNQFNENLSLELLHLGNYLLETDQVKVLVIGYVGEDFSRGLLDERKEIPLEESKETIELAGQAIEVWSRLPFPLITALGGRCDSIALSLAAVADIRIGDESASFTVPEVIKGFVPLGGITQRLPRIIGKGPAMSVLLAGKQLKADEAFSCGLLNQVVEQGTVWEAACAEAEKLAELSSISMQYTKECLLRGSDMPFEQALRLEIDMYMVLQSGEDRMEGVNAFLEKRTPVFKGI